jgi:hypothetical protein
MFAETMDLTEKNSPQKFFGGKKSSVHFRSRRKGFGLAEVSVSQPYPLIDNLQKMSVN